MNSQAKHHHSSTALREPCAALPQAAGLASGVATGAAGGPFLPLLR